ncbi:MAG: alpha/beta fold hydrolase [Trebonia sp.]
MTGAKAPAAGAARPGGPVDWTVCCRHGGLDVPVPVRYREAGGTLLILLHGLGCGKDSFNGAFEAPGLRGYSICALDFPGHGTAARRDLPGGLCTLESCAGITRLAVRQLTELRGRRHDLVHVAGHSMGGAVAVLLAGKLPGTGCTVSIDGNLTAQDCGLASRAIAGQGPDSFAAEGYGRLVSGLLESGRPDLTAWAAWCARADPASVHAAARSLVSWSGSGDLLARFNALLGKKAFIYGDREDKRHLLGRLEGAAISAVPGSGHFPMVDQPARLYEALSRALAPEDLSSGKPAAARGQMPRKR